MKVAHVISGEPYGGAESQFERMVRAFASAGVGQRLIVAPREARTARLREAGLDVIEMDLPGRIGFMARRRIDAALGNYTPDVVVSWTPDVTPLVDRGGYSHVARLGAVFRPQDHLTCAGVFTPSKARADAAMALGWPSQKMKVLPNLPTFAVPQAPVAAVDRRKLFTPATARIVLTAGRLIKSKAFDVLIDAVSNLTSVYIWIAGDGADRADIEEHAYARGMKPRVRFLGWQDDLRPYLAACDVFALSARQDDLPDLVIEAWSLGVPVLSTDTLGAGLLIRDHENGILVPIDNVKAMTEAIRRVLADPALASRIGASGRATCAKDIDGKGVVDAAIDYFKTFVAG